jgi:hypothetical protein
MNYTYNVEQLYVDQDPDLVHDAIAALISWLDPDDDTRQHAFELVQVGSGGRSEHTLTVVWDLGKLSTHDAGLALVLQAQGLHLGEGETVSQDPHELLRQASALKMRATKLRALGRPEEQWAAIVAFHEAARKELAVLELPGDVSVEAEVHARIEACGLFLDARDPESATVQWQRIPSGFHATAEGAARLARLGPVFLSEHAAFAKAWRAFKSSLPRGAALTDAKPKAIRKLCEAYPGVASFWWIAYRHAEARSKWKEAKVTLGRARQLNPDNVRYVALDMLLAPKVLEPEQAMEACRRDWTELRDTSAEVNQMFALSMLRASRGLAERREILGEVHDAVKRAQQLSNGTSLGDQARALRSYVEVLIAGTAPTVTDFARVGVTPPFTGRRVQLEELEEALFARCTPYNDNSALPMAAGF